MPFDKICRPSHSDALLRTRREDAIRHFLNISVVKRKPSRIYVEYLSYKHCFLQIGQFSRIDWSIMSSNAAFESVIESGVIDLVDTSNCLYGLLRVFFKSLYGKKHTVNFWERCHFFSWCCRTKRLEVVKWCGRCCVRYVVAFAMQWR